MPLKVSSRSDIPAFRALEMLKLVNECKQQGEDIINFAPGQPCVGAPEPALKYAIECIESDPKQGYTEAIGMPSLRKRIAEHYKEYYNLDVSYERIAISTGSSGGFTLAFLSAFETGDKIALFNPTYPAYKNIIQSLGLEAVFLDTTSDMDFQPTAELLESCQEDLAGMVLCSPSNPTGTMIKPEKLQKLCEWADKNGVRILSDEAYHGITYDEKAHSAIEYSDNVIVLNTFSKYFAMTGWRLGWLTLPEQLIDPVRKLAGSLTVSPPTLSQHVAQKIFDHKDVLDSYVDVYQENLSILKSELPKAGFSSISNAKGAFYIYADIHNLSNNSEEFCARMLKEAKVATTPGLDFDSDKGQSTIRISYAGTTEDIKEGCKRLIEWQNRS